MWQLQHGDDACESCKAWRDQTSHHVHNTFVVLLMMGCDRQPCNIHRKRGGIRNTCAPLGNIVCLKQCLPFNLSNAASAHPFRSKKKSPHTCLQPFASRRDRGDHGAAGRCGVLTGAAVRPRQHAPY